MQIFPRPGSDSCKVPPARRYPQVRAIGPGPTGAPGPPQSQSAARNEERGAGFMSIGATSPAEGKVGTATAVAYPATTGSFIESSVRAPADRDARLDTF